VSAVRAAILGGCRDIEGARAALRAGQPADLLGLVECGWLDVKAGVYQLGDPAKALAELGPAKPARLSQV